MRNFTVADTLGTLEACLVLLPFMLAPGYVAGWSLNLFEFRQRRLILRLILAVPLSIAICPMLSYMLGRFLPPALWIFYIGVSIAWVVLLARDVRETRRSFVADDNSLKCVWLALGVAALWGATALASLVDLQIGDRLYPSVVAYDHSVRTAMTVAVARHIPPENPFFAHATTPLRYHYLWLLFCSLPMRIIHLSARHVVNAGVIWCGLGLMCTIALGLKFFTGRDTSIPRKTLIGVGLLCVTGLDILPVLYLALARGLWLGDTEWWNEVQITSWAGSMLWVPHNVAALIACFSGFLLLRHQLETHRRWASAPVVIAGLCFASAAGMSVYVTFTFVVAIALWLLALIARKDWLEIAMFFSAGAVALLWASSFLYALRAPVANSGAFAEFALRPFTLGIFFAEQAGIPLTTASAVTIANVMFLPLNYALELGFFLAVAILRLRQLAKGTLEADANELAAWTLVASSFLVGTFLRSTSISSNDLGWRCFLPAQLILLVWGAVMVDDWWFRDATVDSQAAPSRWSRMVLVACLVLGVTSTAYQVFMLRAFPILLDRGAVAGPSWVVPDRHFGKRAYALRSVYEKLDAQLPFSAVLQANPASRDLILHMLYSGRDAAAGDGKCGTDFGGDANLCALRLQTLGSLFVLPSGAALDATCREHGIDAVVVEDLDAVWRNPSSWIWNRRPELANDYVRAFRCTGSP